MILALLNKEWKKTKNVVLIFLSLIFISLAFIYLNISNTLEFNNPSEILLTVITKELLDYQYYVLFMSSFGAFLAFFQFAPEISKGRIRLYLHLPLAQNVLINFISFYGLFLLLIVFILSNIIFFLIITNFYPIEIFYAFNTKILKALILSIIWYLAICTFLVNPSKLLKLGILLLTILINLIIFSTTNSFYSGVYIYYYSLIIIASYYLLLFSSFKTYTKGYIK